MRRPWLVLLAFSACYSQGDGTAPPRDVFYFPVGLQVSANGTVLYAVNSDFDLQYNGGTLQSYDLRLIREHAYDLVTDPRKTLQPGSELPFVRQPDGVCPDGPNAFKNDGSGTRQPLGETCAPPVRSQFYFRNSAIVGAFATDLVLTPPPDRLAPPLLPPVTTTACDPAAPNACGFPYVCGQDKVCRFASCDAKNPCGTNTACFGAAGTHPGLCKPVANRTVDRLFTPIRGNASVTWASVARDVPDAVPPVDYPKTPYAPFDLDCGQGGDGRCDQFHEAGNDENYPEQNSRHITMPGEPFGITLSEDGQSILVTHQSDTKTSLLSTGIGRDNVHDPLNTSPAKDTYDPPSLEFVLDGLPAGGVGIRPIPHDPDAIDFTAGKPPQPAFLWTSRAAAEVDLIRRYDDSGSSLRRPFIDREVVFPITPTAGGTDSRGIVIDPTPRIACKARVAPADPLTGRTQDKVDAETLACARKPARVFIANRSPASLLVGDVGGDTGDGGAYDPDRLTLHTTIPLQNGPSNLYLAPIVDKDGAYALRVFVVCFDSATVFVYDPDTQQVENVIRVAPGPFAMAFDPFRIEDVATNQQVPIDPIEVGQGRKLRRYRFAYIASFTLSHVQLLDLDDAQADRDTFERVVFTLGQPTSPKGT